MDLPEGFNREEYEVNGTRLSCLVGGSGLVIALLHVCGSTRPTAR
jgi:hypothetical protein